MCGDGNEMVLPPVNRQHSHGKPSTQTKKKVLCPLTIQSASKPPTQLDIFIFTQVYGALYLSLVFVIADIADCHIKYNTSFTDPRFVSFSYFSPQVEFFQRPCTTKIGWVFGWMVWVPVETLDRPHNLYAKHIGLTWITKISIYMPTFSCYTLCGPKLVGFCAGYNRNFWPEEWLLGCGANEKVKTEASTAKAYNVTGVNRSGDPDLHPRQAVATY